MHHLGSNMHVLSSRTVLDRLKCKTDHRHDLKSQKQKIWSSFWLDFKFFSTYGHVHMVLPYGNAIWHCHMAMPYGNVIWQSHMAKPYGNAIWQNHMAMPYGNAICHCSRLRTETFSWKFTLENYMFFSRDNLKNHVGNKNL